MRENVDVAWAENKTPAQLEWVFPEFVLMMTGVMRSLSCFRIVAAQKMEKVCGLQLGCAVGLTLLVNQKRESYRGFLLKLPRINGVAQANGSENRSFVTKGLFVFAQLRDMLAAKDSAVVTQENHDRRSFVPQGPEPRLVVIAIGKSDKG